MSESRAHATGVLHETGGVSRARLVLVNDETGEKR
jgi:hypothetical protein